MLFSFVHRLQKVQVARCVEIHQKHLLLKAEATLLFLLQILEVIEIKLMKNGHQSLNRFSIIRDLLVPGVPFVNFHKEGQQVLVVEIVHDDGFRLFLSLDTCDARWGLHT